MPSEWLKMMGLDLLASLGSRALKRLQSPGKNPSGAPEAGECSVDDR